MLRNYSVFTGILTFTAFILFLLGYLNISLCAMDIRIFFLQTGNCVCALCGLVAVALILTCCMSSALEKWSGDSVHKGYWSELIWSGLGPATVLRAAACFSPSKTIDWRLGYNSEWRQQGLRGGANRFFLSMHCKYKQIFFCQSTVNTSQILLYLHCTVCEYYKKVDVLAL